MVEVEEIRRPVVRFQDGQVLLLEVRVHRITAVEGEKKRIVSVVSVGDVHVAQVQGKVAGNGRKIRVQEVVAFLVKLSVVNAEDFVEVRAGTLDLGLVEIEDDDSQRELSEVVAVHLQRLERFS